MASLQFTQPAGNIRASTAIPAATSAGLQPPSGPDYPSDRAPDFFFGIHQSAQLSRCSKPKPAVLRIFICPIIVYRSESATAASSCSPPVPLFTQGIGHQTSTKMDLQGKHIPSPSRRAIRSHITDALGDLTWGEGGIATPAYSSPGAGAYDFGVSSASSSTTNIGTVSPHDLLISAPNSTAFTNLTSPSFSNESPEYIDSFDVSPNFGSNDFDNGASDPWYPLFPQDTSVTDSFPTPALDESPIDKVEDLEVVEPAPQPRRKSGNSPSSHGRHSSVSGVNARRRDKPLPPIIIDDPSDTTALKRARNTLAARKSRERKAQRFDELEEKIAKLEQERDHWKRIAMSRSGGS
ncbi:amino acid starvation-responsive transcription factor GCN4 [Apiospora arundinis]